MKSEKVDQIASALMNAQAEMPAAPMLATNPFLKNKYADLGTIIKTAAPVLVKHGLAVSQQVVTELDRVGVTTTLLHTSGQWIESTVSLPLGEERGKSLAQVAGSVITYLRRYSYGAILGMYTDEDTDGNGHKAETQYPTPATKPAVKDEQPAKEYSSIMTYEEACNITGSDGAKYGNCTNVDLEGKKIGILKALKKSDVDAITQGKYQTKLEAIKVLLAVPEPERMKRNGQMELA